MVRYSALFYGWPRFAHDRFKRNTPTPSQPLGEINKQHALNGTLPRSSNPAFVFCAGPALIRRQLMSTALKHYEAWAKGHVGPSSHAGDDLGLVIWCAMDG
jgi:hypothetical protein